MKIGYIYNAYPEQRCIINKADGKYIQINRNVSYTAIKKILDTLRRKNVRQMKTTNWNLMCMYEPFFVKGIDVLHTFNQVCKVNIPWISTFETTIPRTNLTVNRPWERRLGEWYPDKETQHQLDLIMKDNCGKLIALSNSALRLQENMLRQLSVKNLDVLMGKTVVIPPPQECMCNEDDIVKKYHMAETLNCIFIGRDFFRKGGAALVDALLRCCDDEGTIKFGEHSRRIHLTVVSSLDYDGLFESVFESKEYYKDMLKNTKYITWYESLDNSKVLEMCRDMHIGFLPTFADTYGYSVLEMQASGCPVVTTDIRALPEINNQLCGWIMSLHHDGIGGEAYYHTQKCIADRKKELSERLDVFFEELCNTPIKGIEQKAINARNRIIKSHSPEVYRLALNEIYQEAVR